MALKNKKIDQLIETELSSNQKDLKFTYKMPTRSEVYAEGRLDTGLYGQEYKQLKFKIENYSGGSFSVPKEFLQSGSTPKIRNISNTQNDKNWVTPTYVSDEGSFQKNEFINCEEQNIKKDCVLIINRTSKGKKGEFVGISCFYDFKALGKGHHNQGIYRLQKYTKLEQLMIVCFMNSKNYRTISGYMSYGSKMKELKSDDFSKFVFPTFLQPKQQEIAKEYYNEVEEILSLQNGETGSPLQNYLDSHQNRNRKLGIFQLNIELFDLREELEKLVWDIVMGNEIKTI